MLCWEAYRLQSAHSVGHARSEEGRKDCRRPLSQTPPLTLFSVRYIYAQLGLLFVCELWTLANPLINISTHPKPYPVIWTFLFFIFPFSYFACIFISYIYFSFILMCLILSTKHHRNWIAMQTYSAINLILIPLELKPFKAWGCLYFIFKCRLIS